MARHINKRHQAFLTALRQRMQQENQEYYSEQDCLNYKLSEKQTMLQPTKFSAVTKHKRRFGSFKTKLEEFIAEYNDWISEMEKSPETDYNTLNTMN